MSSDERKLIGFFTADTDVDELVDAIIASLPPDKLRRESAEPTPAA